MIINIEKFLTNPVKSGVKSRVIAEIFADKKSELSESEEIKKYEIAQSSVAYIIKSGEIYIMGGDGVWYSPDGEAIS